MILYMPGLPVMVFEDTRPSYSPLPIRRRDCEDAQRRKNRAEVLDSGPKYLRGLDPEEDGWLIDRLREKMRAKYRRSLQLKRLRAEDLLHEWVESLADRE